MAMTDQLQNPILDGQAPLPLLLVLSGPSGAGKDSVLIRMQERGIPFYITVNANSRPPRPGERDGIDYHFVTPKRFEDLIAQEALLEWAHVYGSYRGVLKSEVRKALALGTDVVLRVNVDGALTIKRMVPGAILIFLTTESPNDLRHRLHTRQTDSAEEIERRLSLVRDELHYVTHFDYVIMNRTHQLDETVETLIAIMTAEKHRTVPRRVQL